MESVRAFQGVYVDFLHIFELFIVFDYVGLDLLHLGFGYDTGIEVCDNNYDVKSIFKLFLIVYLCLAHLFQHSFDHFSTVLFADVSKILRILLLPNGGDRFGDQLQLELLLLFPCCLNLFVRLAINLEELLKFRPLFWGQQSLQLFVELLGFVDQNLGYFNLLLIFLFGHQLFCLVQKGHRWVCLKCLRPLIILILVRMECDVFELVELFLFVWWNIGLNFIYGRLQGHSRESLHFDNVGSLLLAQDFAGETLRTGVDLEGTEVATLLLFFLA